MRILKKEKKNKTTDEKFREAYFALMCFENQDSSFRHNP